MNKYKQIYKIKTVSEWQEQFLKVNLHNEILTICELITDKSYETLHDNHH